MIRVILDTGYHIEQQDPKRVKEGVKMLSEALAKAEQERQNRPCLLPKDWRNRILR